MLNLFQHLNNEAGTFLTHNCHPELFDKANQNFKGKNFV